MTVAQALAAALALGLDRLDAQLLLLHALGRPAGDRAWLLAHDQDSIDAQAQQRLLQHCQRRSDGEPLAYLVGEKEFFGLTLKVDARVLVPRPDTETLVGWALELLPLAGAAPRVLDLGTGSGAIALAIKKHSPSTRVEAVDASAAALEVAAGNAGELGLEIAFRHASWWVGAAGRYDLGVSNPPYVAVADVHLTALRHEPLGALAAGPDGLDDLRAIVADAPAHLAPGAWLLLEHGWDQAQAVRTLLRAAGLIQVGSRRDLARIERCSGGQWLERG
jgi:release factor glutamine methyltransferase